MARRTHFRSRRARDDQAPSVVDDSAADLGGADPRRAGDDGVVDARADATAGDAGDVGRSGHRLPGIRALPVRRDPRRPQRVACAAELRPWIARTARPTVRAAALRWLAAAALIAGARAEGSPLQLRADAIAATASPSGLLTLEADGALDRRLSAEAVVWMGSADDARPDVLVMVLRAHTADGRASARVGRFIASLGALRPVQIDGAAGRLRLPLGLDVEAM